MGQVAVVILICYFYGVHALPFGSSFSAQPDVDSEKPAALCRMAVPKWIFRPYDEHFSLQTALQRYRNETDPQVRAEKTRGLANLLEVRAEMELLHQKMQTLVCNGTVLKQHFADLFACVSTNTGTIGDTCQKEAAHVIHGSPDCPEIPMRKCELALYGDKCGGKRAIFDLVRFEVLLDKPRRIQLYGEQSYTPPCYNETMDAVYEAIFLNAPDDVVDIFAA